MRPQGGQFLQPCGPVTRARPAQTKLSQKRAPCPIHWAHPKNLHPLGPPQDSLAHCSCPRPMHGPHWLVQRPPPGRHQCSSRCRVCRRFGQPAEPPPWHSPSTGKEETVYRVACPTPQASPAKGYSSPPYVPKLTSSRLPEPREPPLNTQISSLLLPPLKSGPRNGILGPKSGPSQGCLHPTRARDEGRGGMG